MPPKRKTGNAARQKAKQGAKALSDNPEDCPVCLTTFTDTVQRPRTLPCGHTFCTRCINELQEQYDITCPSCRARHAVPESGQFPISYTVEALINRMRDTTVASASPPACAGEGASEAGTPVRKGEAGLSKSMRSLLQEQEAKVLSAITACQGLQSQLDLYQTTLTSWQDHQQQLEDKLQAVIEDSRNSRELLQQSKSKAANKKMAVHQKEQQLQGVLGSLQRVSTDQQAGIAVVDVIRCTDDAEQRLEECSEMFPDVHAVTTARKAIVASTAAVNAAEDAECAAAAAATAPAAGDDNLPADSTSTLTLRLQSLVTLPLDVEDLRSLTQPARTMLRAGLVFPAHKFNGHTRHAKIRLEEECLYLHCLRDQIPPLGAAVLQMDEVLPPSFPRLVFLDLSWPGTARRRVLLRLSPDTPMARQFVLLCTGERGPTYANTKLFKVGNKGKPGEFVLGGAYDTNDNTGGPALLPNLDKGDYRKSGKAGAVCRTARGGDTSDCNAQFAIVTRDRKEGREFSLVFGEVEAGLDVLVAAARHTPITEVTVVDCGVVV